MARSIEADDRRGDRADAVQDDMVIANITRSSMVLRAVCGLWIVGAVMAAGFMLRSPWIIAPLGLSFAALFVIGKWGAWKHAIRSGGWTRLPLGLLTTIPIQCAIVALFYGAALGLTLLSSTERTLQPFGAWDMNYSAVVLLVGGVLGIAAHVIESRAEPEDGYLRAQLAEDGELPEDLKRLILGSDADETGA
ncbi:hypothetical protein Poly30_06400 [Planctomycetes bacterium Poly30]|uniref:Uncharacterized protein n=1 Tax=Saltatorellus ferox TaxID=2528018 RepID=A0A518EM24_9BACT|nr:hypothetical protein Poly30_06400 [Planctomycetes bacterium Poly30]